MTQQWKPIESAPKDGSRVLIWHPDYCAPITAQWYGSEGWKMDSDVSPFWQQPTHWMPLPAEPSKYAGDHDGMEDDPRTHWQQPATPPASAQDDAKDVDARWYAVGRDGAATLCTCEEDARETAAESAQLFPNCAPYTAVQLIPAPAAGDALDAQRYRWLRDQTETDGIAIVMKDMHFDESRTCAENIDKFIDAALAAQVPHKGDAA